MSQLAQTLLEALKIFLKFEQGQVRLVEMVLEEADEKCCVFHVKVSRDVHAELNQNKLKWTIRKKNGKKFEEKLSIELNKISHKLTSMWEMRNLLTGC